jgi:DNA polymerase III delta prime subunit
MRPRTLDEVVGQDALAGPQGTLRKLLATGHLPNLILHGPPGTGKTTLARVIARESGLSFVPFNAVSEGVPRLREVVKEAETRRRAGRGTLLFVDEIHRLNKGQQDFLLPWLESGLLTLVGATTEHPGFEINPALLSRSRVLVLEPLDEAALRTVVRHALEDAERGLGALGVRLDADAEDALVQHTGGDARQALTGVEIAAQLAGAGGDRHGRARARGAAAPHVAVRHVADVRAALRVPQVAARQPGVGRAVLGDADDPVRRGPQVGVPAPGGGGVRGRGAGGPAGGAGGGAGDARLRAPGAAGGAAAAVQRHPLRGQRAEVEPRVPGRRRGGGGGAGAPRPTGAAAPPQPTTG